MLKVMIKKKKKKKRTILPVMHSEISEKKSMLSQKMVKSSRAQCDNKKILFG